MEKTLRYLLMVVAMMGVLSVSAQTPKYGKTYKPLDQQTYGVYVNPQMPSATMGSTGSALMTTGSTLPQAALTGTMTADESVGGKAHPGHIRRTNEDDGFEDEGEEPVSGPPGEPDPLGDVLWPLALLACMYALMRAILNRKRAGESK